MDDSPAIEIEDVWFSYNGPPVLREVRRRVADAISEIRKRLQQQDGQQ